MRDSGEMVVCEHHVSEVPVAGDEAFEAPLEQERRTRTRCNGFERSSRQSFLEAVARPQRARRVARTAEPATRPRFGRNGHSPRVARGKPVVVIVCVHRKRDADVTKVTLAGVKSAIAA